MSESNEEIEKEFREILKKEYSSDFKLIQVSHKFIVFWCYALPMLAMMTLVNHNGDPIAAMIFAGVIGTGFFMYYRHSKIIRGFIKQDKPLKQVITEIRQQERNDPLHEIFGNQLTPTETAHWNSIISDYEESQDSNEMNVSTLFDTNNETAPTVHLNPAPIPVKRSWLKRLFRRK